MTSNSMPGANERRVSKVFSWTLDEVLRFPMRGALFHATRVLEYVRGELCLVWGHRAIPPR
jgi:hypothetical protein